MRLVALWYQGKGPLADDDRDDVTIGRGRSIRLDSRRRGRGSVDGSW